MEPIQTIANDGTPIVTFEQQRDLAQEIIRGTPSLRKTRKDFGFRKLNPDGTVARSHYTTKAVNKDWFFDNRFRVVGKKVQVVSAQTSEGYRAIQGLAKGQIYKKHILAYEFERKNGELEVTRVLVSDSDFITHFTKKLGEDDMNLILPFITSGGTSVPEEKLPI